MVNSRVKDLKNLGEPFRSYNKLANLIEESRARYCFFQIKVLKKNIAEVCEEIGISRQRLDVLIKVAVDKYGANMDEYDEFCK